MVNARNAVLGKGSSTRRGGEGAQRVRSCGKLSVGRAERWGGLEGAPDLEKEYDTA